MVQETGTDRGQSEVIGVVLIVGIVVVLSAAVGLYLVDLSDPNVEKSPTTKFDAEQYNETNVWLYQAGGETISDPNTLSITINGTDVFEANGEQPSDYVGEVNATTEFYLGLSTSDEYQIATKPTGVDKRLKPGSKIKVVWNSKEEDSSATLFEHEVEAGD